MGRSMCVTIHAGHEHIHISQILHCRKPTKKCKFYFTSYRLRGSVMIFKISNLKGRILLHIYWFNFFFFSKLKLGLSIPFQLDNSCLFLSCQLDYHFLREHVSELPDKIKCPQMFLKVKVKV